MSAAGRGYVAHLVALFLALAGLLAGAPASGQDQTGPIEARASDAIIGWIKAVASGEPQRIAAVIAPEFQIVRADGSTYGAPGYLKSQLPIIAAIPHVENLVVTTAGDIVVASYTINVNQTRDGVVVEADAPRLTVFRIDGEKWLVVAHGNFAALEE